MKILFFHAAEIEAPGGSELATLNLAEGLAKRGHHTAIIELGAKTAKRQLASGLTVWTIPWAKCPEANEPLTLASFLRGFRLFRQVVSEMKPDIVSVQFPSFQMPFVVAASAFPHKWRLTVTAHGSDIRVLPFSQPRQRYWRRQLFERADAVTAVSQTLMDDLLKLHPDVRDKAHVIHNSVTSNWLETANHDFSKADRPYVLFVGSFHKVKGVDLLLRAWRLLQNRQSGISLWLVGEGPEFSTLTELSEELQINDSVQFFGRKAQSELPSLYRSAQLVVIPSRNEGLPLVSLEAGACGAICVATSVGGLPEVIEPEVTGFLVEPESPEALADGLLRVLDTPLSERQSMRTAAKARIAQHFDREKMLAGYEELFQAVLERVPHQTSD